MSHLGALSFFFGSGSLLRAIRPNSVRHVIAQTFELILQLVVLPANVSVVQSHKVLRPTLPVQRSFPSSAVSQARVPCIYGTFSPLSSAHQ
jgi:hypothetical protein